MGYTIFIEKKYIKDPKKYPFRIYSDLQSYISSLTKDKDGKIKCHYEEIEKDDSISKYDLELQEESIFYSDEHGAVIRIHYENKDDQKDYVFETKILNELFFRDEGKIEMIDSLEQNISSLFSFIKDHKLCDDITTNKLSSTKDEIIKKIEKYNPNIKKEENSEKKREIENKRDLEIRLELEIFLKQLETYLKYLNERQKAKGRLIERLAAKKAAKPAKDGSKRKSTKRKSTKRKSSKRKSSKRKIIQKKNQTYL